MRRRAVIGAILLVGVVLCVVGALPAGSGAHGMGVPTGVLMFVTHQRPEVAQIRVVRADGTGLRSLTPDGESNHAPAWSPDGKRIAYISTRNERNAGISSLWLMNADGNGKRQVTDALVNESIPPRW